MGLVMKIADVGEGLAVRHGKWTVAISVAGLLFGKETDTGGDVWVWQWWPPCWLHGHGTVGRGGHGIVVDWE